MKPTVKHCHHYYNENDKPDKLQHAHPMSNVRHSIPELDEKYPVYWDHEGFDCDGDSGGPEDYT